MVRPMHSIKIDLARVPGIVVRPNQAGKTFLDVSALFHGKNGAIYLDCVVFENDQPDQFGNDYAVKANQSKEDRLAGVKAPYIGSGKKLGRGTSKPSQSRTAPASAPVGSQFEDEIPF